MLLLFDFNRFIPVLFGQPFLFWSKLQRFPYMGGLSFFGTLVQVLHTSLFFSHLFRVISPDNLSPYQGTLFLLSNFLTHAVCDVNPGKYFSQTVCHHKRELVLLELFSQTSTFIPIASFYM